MRKSTFRRPLHGFTIIELLVVVAIIGILIALLIPAVQSARESARQMTCKSHLKQIGLAAQLHEEAHGYFPSGGWGFCWVGDPDMGFGAKHPGGWIYSLLPYLELENIHQMGAGLPWNTPEKWRALGERGSRVVSLFHCPSRRPPMTYPRGLPIQDINAIRFPRINFHPAAKVAKSDYAASSSTYGALWHSTPSGNRSRAPDPLTCLNENVPQLCVGYIRTEGPGGTRRGFLLPERDRTEGYQRRYTLHLLRRREDDASSPLRHRGEWHCR